jgi:hypothetical protein
MTEVFGATLFSCSISELISVAAKKKKEELTSASRGPCRKSDSLIILLTFSETASSRWLELWQKSIPESNASL